MKKGQTLPVDKFVGNRVRMRRIDLGMTQEKLAEVLDVSFQQIQKYEKGINRISSSKLAGISDVLRVPISWFFDGAPGNAGSTQIPIETDILEFMATKEGLSIARNFRRLKDPALRRSLLNLVENIATNVSGSPSLVL